MEELYTKIITDLYNYLIKNNLHCMILGLSGGVDSTVSAYICHMVSIKSHNTIKFIAVNMSFETNNESYNVADTLGNYLADEYIVHGIKDEFNAISSNFMKSQSLQTYKQQDNIKARIRMMFLYDLALQNKGLVIDTANLTERYLGFWTLHGNVGDIAPIADLWKTEVYSMLQYIIDNEKNTDIKNILQTIVMPNSIISNNNVSLTYIDIDIILKRIINARYIIVDYNDIKGFINSSYIKDLTQKYGEDNITMIINRYFHSHYKRKALPIKINKI